MLMIGALDRERKRGTAMTKPKESTPPIPQFPGGPDPTKPVPRDPVDGVDLRRYAYLSALLAEKKAPRDKTLADAGLADDQWNGIEQTWMLRIGVAALQGDVSMAREYGDLYTEAQDAYGPKEPTRSMEEYAAVMARIESGEPAPRVIAANGLSLADWARLHRAWAARIAADGELGDRYRAIVKRLRGTA
jgi:hypothetical protein